VGIISGPETILLVDDEPFILDVGEKMLIKMGYTVIKACCGEEALRVFGHSHQKIDLVILDMIMPDIGGDEVFDRLKKIKSSIKVLLATGDSRGQAATTMDKGCNGFIQKPFSMEKLSHAIREVIDSDAQSPSIYPGPSL
jgi:CheY-like chemotaxis protein